MDFILVGDFVSECKSVCGVWCGRQVLSFPSWRLLGSLTGLIVPLCTFQGDPSPTASIVGLASQPPSRGAESGCNVSLMGSEHCSTLKPEPTDHCSALSNHHHSCQEGAAQEWQVTLVCRGQEAYLSGRTRSQMNPALAFKHREGHPSPSVLHSTSVQVLRAFWKLLGQSFGLRVIAAHPCHWPTANCTAWQVLPPPHLHF